MTGLVEVLGMEDNVIVDATGLVCPMPLLKAKRALNAMEVGQTLLILATDHTSHQDLSLIHISEPTRPY